MSGTRAYLAGPMRGYPLWNFPAFDHAAAWLRRGGWQIVNPAELDRATGFSEHTTELPDGFIHEAMRRDIEALLNVEAIVLLPGWRDSVGAQMEVGIAEALGLAIYEISVSEPYTLTQPVKEPA